MNKTDIIEEYLKAHYLYQQLTNHEELYITEQQLTELLEMANAVHEPALSPDTF